MIGSIAMLDEGEEPGITSPDYVVFRPRPGILHPRWFYYWLRSKYGEDLIRSLARGAVRERLLFKRLVPGVVTVPDWPTQNAIAQKLAVINTAEKTARESADITEELPAAFLRAFFRVGVQSRLANTTSPGVRRD
jgi:type I restriction enzyme S subunit